MQSKQIIKSILPAMWSKQLKNFWLLSKVYAQSKSISENKCLDKDGNETPWYTYPAIEYLKGLDFSDASILEFGSGASSIWWANRAKSVLAIEHNREWYEIIKKKSTPQLEIQLAEKMDEYLAAGMGNKFDVVVIDGIYRHDCANAIAQILNQDGIVILDNSDWHPDTAKLLRDNYDFLQVDFHGFGPINDYTWTTSIFLSRSFRCIPKNKRLPEYSAGALIQLASGQKGA